MDIEDRKQVSGAKLKFCYHRASPGDKTKIKKTNYKVDAKLKFRTLGLSKGQVQGRLNTNFNTIPYFKNVLRTS